MSDAGSGPQRGAAAWLKAKPIVVAFAVFAMIAFAGLYFVLDGNVEWQGFVRELIPNVWVALAAFLVVNYLLYHERLDSLTGITGHLVDQLEVTWADRERARVYNDAFDPTLDWGELFRSSGEVTILGRYLDRWVGHLFPVFVEFFAKGGALTVILPDSGNNTLVGIIARQSFTSGVPKPAQMKQHMQGGPGKLKEAHAKALAGGAPAAHNARLRIVTTDQSVNFWAVRFKNQAIIGLIPHWPSDFEPPPMELFHLGTEEVVARFLDHELQEFTQHSQPLVAL
jgi:hypothetical protein